MLTNVILGAILGTILGVFLILNSKVTQLQNAYLKLIDTLSVQSDNINSITKILDKLLDKFNKRILVDIEHFEIIKDLIINKYQDLSNDNAYLKERINTLDSDIQNLIIAEHRCTRNEIKKKAKISSKIKSQSKTDNNTNKQ